MKTNPNHPAHPISEEETDRIDSGVTIYTGMTKLETISTAAMQGMLQAGAMTEHGAISFAPETIAKQAVMQAKALIAELNKGEQ